MNDLPFGVHPPQLRATAILFGRQHHFTMVENGKKHRQNSRLIIHVPTSEGVSEVSAAEGASEASSPEQANHSALMNQVNSPAE